MITITLGSLFAAVKVEGGQGRWGHTRKRYVDRAERTRRRKAVRKARRANR